MDTLQFISAGRTTAKLRFGKRTKSCPLWANYKRKIMAQRQIGDYLLLQQLGQGSMGETFLAQHRFLKQPFILKILPPELSTDAEFIKRFEKEVASLSRLEHPHLAKIHI